MKNVRKSKKLSHLKDGGESDGVEEVMDMMLRFLIGGIVVSVFAILGDVVKPESLGGVFAAAPTIALGYAGADNAQTWGRLCGHRGKVDGSWRDRLFRVCVCGELRANALAREGTDDSDRSFTNMVCNSRGAMGALAAEIE